MEDDAARGGEEAVPGGGAPAQATAGRAEATPEVVRFSGHFPRSIDDKGRLVLPPPFRDELRAGAHLRKVERGVALWPPEVLVQIRHKLLDQGRRGNLGARNALRALTANAPKVIPDSQGRIPFPAELRAHAGIDTEVVVVGADDRVELWAPDRWAPVSDDGEAVLDAEWATYGF